MRHSQGRSARTVHERGRVVLCTLLLPIVLCVAPVYGHADSGDNGTQREVQMETVVISATGSERAIDELFADVDVVSELEIQNAAANNVDDLLRKLGGIDVDKQSDLGMRMPASYNIRGVVGRNRVLFLVDDVPINSPLTGFVEANQVQLSAIDHIEVVKGAFSSLYGSNAMGGVINVITKKRRFDGVDITPYVKAGSDDFRESGVRLTGRRGPLHVALNASHRSIDNQFRNGKRVDYSYNILSGVFKKEYTATQNAGYRDSRLFMRLDYDIDHDTSLSLTGSYTDAWVGLDKTRHLATPRDKYADRSFWFLNAAAQTKMWDRVDFRLRLYTSYDGNRAKRENIEETPLPVFRYEWGTQFYWGRDTGMEAQAAMPWGSVHFLTLGFDYRYKQGYWKNRSQTRETIGTVLDRGMNQQAVYVQNETELFSRLNITFGGRFDVNSRSDEAFSPKLGVRYNVSDRITLRGSVGKSFRAPNLSELYMPAWEMIPGIPFMSNPDLDPETIVSYDLGVSIKLTDWMKFHLTGFYTSADDLIYPVMGGGKMQYENLNKVDTDGFEAALEGEILTWLSGYLNYTYTHAVDRDEGRLGDVPLHRINAGLRAVSRPTPNTRLTTSLDGRFTDSMFYRDRMTGTPTQLASFTVLDLTLRLDLFERLSLKGVLTNLTDKEYVQHNADIGPERSYWMEMEYRF